MKRAILANNLGKILDIRLDESKIFCSTILSFQVFNKGDESHFSSVHLIQVAKLY